MDRSLSSLQEIPFGDDDQKDEGSWPDPSTPRHLNTSTQTGNDTERRRSSQLKDIIPSSEGTAVAHVQSEVEPLEFNLGKNGQITRADLDQLSYEEEDPQSSPVQDEFAFKFLPPGEEPVLEKSFQERAERAMKAFADQIFSQPPPQDEPQMETTSGLTPPLKRASSMGLKMLMKVLFPAMPHFLQDFWVFLEFSVTLLSFILAMVALDLGENTTLNVVALILSIIGIILALIDGYIYFFQISHTFKAITTCILSLFHSKISPAQAGEDNELAAVNEVEKGENGEEETRRKWWQFSDEVKEKFNSFFEVGRTVISELVLYPTLVCDLLDFVSGVTEVADNLKEGDTDRLDFSLFLLGNLYTIIAVYFMRLLVIVGVFAQIRKLPASSSGSPKGYMAIIGRFCLHVTSQIVCHALIAVALSAKIHQENPGDQEGLKVSPFLWIMIVLGGIIPLAGIAIFFLTNFYWMNTFSVNFWLDMVSLLQGESFAEVVFGGESTSAAKEKSQELAEKSEFSDVKKDFKVYQSASLWIKATFPLRYPLFVILGLLYNLVLVVFMTSMAFSTDSGDITFVLFDTAFLTAMFFIMLVSLLVANFHVILGIVAFMFYLPYTLFTLVSKHVMTHST